MLTPALDRLSESVPGEISRKARPEGGENARAVGKAGVFDG